MVERHRPIGISILAILAFIAGVFTGWAALMYLGIAPIALFSGEWGFFGAALLGGILWGIVAIIWLAVGGGLWSLNPQAWGFVVIYSIFCIVFSVISVLGATTWGAVLPGIIIYGLILLYALSPGVKEAFGTTGQSL